MAKSKPDPKKEHIRLIITRNSREDAVKYILQNGYANSVNAAEKLVDIENGIVR